MKISGREQLIWHTSKWFIFQKNAFSELQHRLKKPQQYQNRHLTLVTQKLKGKYSVSHIFKNKEEQCKDEKCNTGEGIYFWFRAKSSEIAGTKFLFIYLRIYLYCSKKHMTLNLSSYPLKIKKIYFYWLFQRGSQKHTPSGQIIMISECIIIWPLSVFISQMGTKSILEFYWRSTTYLP